MMVGKGWYLFLCEHDIIKRGNIFQPVFHLTLGMYGIHPPLARYLYLFAQYFHCPELPVSPCTINPFYNQRGSCSWLSYNHDLAGSKHKWIWGSEHWVFMKLRPVISISFVLKSQWVHKLFLSYHCWTKWSEWTRKMALFTTTHFCV